MVKVRPVSSILFLLAALCAVCPLGAAGQRVVATGARLTPFGPVRDWRTFQQTQRRLTQPPLVVTRIRPLARWRADSSRGLNSPEARVRFQRPPPWTGSRCN